MFQSEFLADQEAKFKAMKRRQTLSRIVYGIRNLLLCSFCFLGGATFAYVYATITNTEVPKFIWDVSFIGGSLTYFFLGVYYLFATLDEIFFAPHNTRRITRRRR